MHFLWLALLVATSLAERAADGADVLAPIDIDGELGFPDTEVDDEGDISDSDKEDDMLRKPLDIPKLEAGNLPITKVFTRAGLDAAANSAGCGNKPEWRSRLAAVHDLVAHTYILTLPRPAKVNAATDTAERYVSSRAQQRPLKARGAVRRVTIFTDRNTIACLPSVQKLSLRFLAPRLPRLPCL